MSSEGFYLLGTRFPSPPVTSIRVRKLLEVFVTTTRATGAGLQSTAHASQRFLPGPRPRARPRELNCGDPPASADLPLLT